MWEFVEHYDIELYKCGLKAGQRVSLRKDLAIKDCTGKATGKIYPKGDVWKVLHGSSQDPDTIWLLNSDGERCTWDDTVEAVNEWFKLL